MDLMLIRHADAEDAPPTLADGDLGRRLTRKGRDTARRVFKRLRTVCKAPDLIISSEAVRARQTAELLAEAYGGLPLTINTDVNPGCGPDDLQRVLAGTGSLRRMAIVGHQPDLSILISHLAADDRLCLSMKKCAIAMIRLAVGRRQGELCWLAPPALFEIDD